MVWKDDVCSLDLPSYRSFSLSYGCEEGVRYVGALV